MVKQNNNMVAYKQSKYGENFSVAELKQNSDNIKEYYIRNILRLGLPSIHFDTKFKVVFANEEYWIDMLDLKHLDFMGSPIEGQENKCDRSIQHYLSIGYHKAMIPARVNGKFVLLSAQHKLGSIILTSYFRKKWELLDELNFVLESINGYEFGEENTFDKFYTSIFGKPEDKVFRIPL